MNRSLVKCVYSLLSCACGIAGCIFVLEPTAVSAATPDFPRIQAEAERGSIRHEVQMGASYMTGAGVAQNFERAAYWYERAANAGDPLAQNEIGYFYQVGIGVPRSPERAVEWYRRSASGGYLRAKVNLGVVYLWGIGVKKDPQLGYDLIREAAARNYGLADAYLGKMYDFGQGVPVDLNLARTWYERGARLNDSMAQYGLAIIISRGNPSKQDLLKEERLLRKSTKGGFVAARHTLGLLLVNHPELPAQPNEAIELLRSASEAGIWQSSAVLGALYRDGRDVSTDPAKADYYFRLSELQGGATARLKVTNDLNLLARKLTPDQLLAIDAEATEWLKSHPLTLQFQYKDTGNSTDFPVFAISIANDDIHAGQLIPVPPADKAPLERN